MRGVAYSPDFKALLMGLHQRGETLSALSREHHVARELLSRWWREYEADGLDGLQPRSRRPHTSPRQTTRATVQRVLRLRARGRSAVWIARELDLGYGTVQRLLEAHGVNRLPRPARPKPRGTKSSAPANWCTSISNICRPSEMLEMTSNLLPSTISVAKPSCGLRRTKRAPRRLLFSSVSRRRCRTRLKRC